VLRIGISGNTRRVAPTLRTLLALLPWTACGAALAQAPERHWFTLELEGQRAGFA
jgi:hypothetical protein